MPQEKITNDAISIYIKHIESNGQRKTPERIAILKEIYSIHDHFDVESLYNRMVDNKYVVSRATIYNTIEHLLEVKLIRKHQFVGQHSTYEKSLQSNQHDHVIMTDTGKVLEFCDPRIEVIKSTIEKVFGVEVTGHSLHFYAKTKAKEK